jgi:hypothetical protein
VWLKEVFHPQTKEKARREYRLLLLDGHESHLTIDFITFCDENKIILVLDEKMLNVARLSCVFSFFCAIFCLVYCGGFSANP